MDHQQTFTRGVGVIHYKTRDSLPETNSKFAPENRPGPNRKVVFQPSIFRGELLVSGRVSSSFVG